jgi:rSAM/selenodomain-associated transferase 1
MDERAMNDPVIIFLKTPRPGLVKTRLARSLGDQAACAAYRQLVDTLLENLKAVEGVQLRYAPDDAQAEIAPWLRPGWTSAPQGDGDLGNRLVAAFAHAFARGAERVLILGSDCPSVTPGDLAAGFEMLHRLDVVLGPAEDGGYWLIGLRELRPELFVDMPWSTSRVLPLTLERARNRALSVGQLRELADVDTERDWLKFLGAKG